MKFKEVLKKFWDIVWKDDSPKGWLITIVFLFVMIKFVFFPTLSFITGTSLPLAIVESCSMYHDNNLLSNYNVWWEKHSEKYSELGMEKEQFKKFIFKKGFNKGDILFILGANPDKLKIGDVIIFASGAQKTPVIHRIIDIKDVDGEKVFSTIGDNNNGQISFEKEIHENQLIGKAVFKLAPYVGWSKLIFFENKQPESNKGFCQEN